MPKWVARWATPAHPTGKDGETIEIFDTKRENNVGVHLANSIPLQSGTDIHRPYK